MTELSKRPPDYRKALATLRNAANRLDAIGGGEPGQAKLKGAVEASTWWSIACRRT